MKELDEVAEKVKSVDDGVNNIIVPILKDTIKDNNLHNKRLFISNIALIILILIVSIIAMGLSVYQNYRYTEFLSQFEFENDTVIQKTNNYSNINDGIRIMK